MLTTEKECIDYIHSAGRFGQKAGLCNIKALLNHLGNPHLGLKCIHVAGTNGKGSVSAMLASILREAGFRVGMNTSPYIEVFNERLTINGVNIPGDKLVKYTNLVAEAIENLKDVHPIEFEIITAIGFLYFKEEKCDYSVIECGIGGLLDSTNVIEDPALCVIARLGIDHTEILGDTPEDIALQKAGIIKPGSRCVIHPDISPLQVRVIEDYAQGRGACVSAPKQEYKVLESGLYGTRMRVDNLQFLLPLVGEFQVANARLAVCAAKELGIDDLPVTKGMESVRWKCRFERVGDHIVIDGAHNLQGISAFCRSVNKYIPSENRVLVIGMLNDKDFDSCAMELSHLEGSFIITGVPSIRQTGPLEVYSRIRDFIPDAIYEPDYTKAMESAIALSGQEGYVCVAGSLYLAGAVRSYLT